MRNKIKANIYIFKFIENSVTVKTYMRERQILRKDCAHSFSPVEKTGRTDF